jgi:hypothetical protein
MSKLKRLEDLAVKSELIAVDFLSEIGEYVSLNECVNVIFTFSNGQEVLLSKEESRKTKKIKFKIVSEEKLKN